MSFGRALGIVAAVVLAIAFIAALIGKPAPPAERNAAAAATDSPADNMTADTLVVDASPAPAAASAADENWSYSTDEDKVRGGTSYFASTTSTNTVHQDSPYDAETRMTMMLRQSKAYGTDVILTISSGQMMCPSYEGCSGTVRFDAAPPEHIRFNGPSDDSSETVFVSDARGFIARLRKAHKVVIEKTLYQAGNPQFEFDVSGLKWDH